MSLLDRLRRHSLGETGAGSLAASDAPTSDEYVAGERGVAAVQRPPSLQSRMSNILAFGLMSAVAVGLLGWYYVHSLGRQTNARDSAQASAKVKAKGEMAVPPLGRVDPPVVRGSSSLEALLGDAPEEPPLAAGVAWSHSNFASSPAGAGFHSPQTKTAADLLLERQLAGPAFARRPATNSSETGASQPSLSASLQGAPGELRDYLRPSVTDTVSARVLPTQKLLLPKGAFIDCTLETAIDSSLPGMTTCVMATDSFSADGSVVLLERGTKLVGETRGQVRAGSARVFVLWTEARTPKGVVVPLASPGTDELGRAGLPGEVNRHFFERFGAAILISVIDGAVQAAVQAQRDDGGTVVVTPSASSQIMTEVLKSTIAIPPTVVKAQGDRIQVLVARDLDFRSVYELRPASSDR